MARDSRVFFWWEPPVLTGGVGLQPNGKACAWKVGFSPGIFSAQGPRLKPATLVPRIQGPEGPCFHRTAKAKATAKSKATATPAAWKAAFRNQWHAIGAVGTPASCRQVLTLRPACKGKCKDKIKFAGESAEAWAAKDGQPGVAVPPELRQIQKRRRPHECGRYIGKCKNKNDGNVKNAGETRELSFRRGLAGGGEFEHAVDLLPGAAARGGGIVGSAAGAWRT